VIRIDRWVGAFLDSLDVMVGQGRVLVALSADHGIQPYPEGLVAEGQPAGRSSVSALIRAVDSTLATRYRMDFGLGASSGLLLGDVGEMRARGINTDSLSDTLAERVRAMTGVRQVFTPRSLAAAPASDAEAGRWRRQINDRVEWLVAAALEPNWMWGSAASSTNHGTTNHGDMNVPIAFMGPGIAAQVSTRAARTIDIGTTLAALLGVRPLEAVEGIALPEVTAGRR
jgi:arylsulfatase A-like enzyme